MIFSGYGLVILLLVLIVIALIQLRNIQKVKDLLLFERSPIKEENSVEKDSIDTLDSSTFNKEIEELKSQLKSKTIELAKSEKDSDEKNKLLNEIREKILHCSKNPDSLPRISKDVLAMLDAAVVAYDSTFEIQLDELHQEFSKKLRKKFPDLTAHDLRLATYIKIGLNSKEMADLLNIKPSSVYISRSRLRKKINLDSEADLHGYLNSI